MNEIENPIDRLLARGLTGRDLVSYMLPGIVWLAEHQDETFRLCYHDDAGQVVVEAVAAPDLITRARELGWTVDDPNPDHPYCMFGEAIYHFRRGVHWFATACDDTTEMLPLALPARELAAAKKRDDRLYNEAARARRARAHDRQVKRQKEVEERKAVGELNAAVQIAADDFQAEAVRAGKPITPATARRKAWKHIRKCDDWTYHLLLKRLRAMQSQEAKA
ncbi:hypothetical protein GIW57_05360 [Stenotrophomonas sp. PA-6-5C]|uniref:hypothetical protein n=1 Tax=Stenotrophomonas sp. PA-6-5C TaxID=2665487 RepID=UPI001F1D0DBD|nr:hypothetical protein [Stenotrophomonas sp. PA-6-5C]MCF5089604.1 hypothetical protein [Stenotrophomonas sp. PA-6-5C]